MTDLPVTPAPLAVIPASFNVTPAPIPSFLRRQESIPNGQPDTAQWTVMKRLF
jgi:hypothetical protein